MVVGIGGLLWNLGDSMCDSATSWSSAEVCERGVATHERNDDVEPA